MKKKKIIWLGAGLLVLALGAWQFFANRKPAVEYTTVKAERANLSQTVSETGSVKPLNEVQLNFLSAGRLSEVNVKVGDVVKKDQLLAALDTSDLNIRVKESEAQVAVARAQLDKLLAGATEEEVEVAEANMDSAQTAYDSSVAELDRVRKLAMESVSQAEKSYQDIATDQGTITTYEQAINQAALNLENAKKTYSRAINNQTDALTISMRSKVPVAATALDAVNRILDDDNLEAVLSVKNSAYLTQTKNAYNDARAQLAKADTALKNLNNQDKDQVKEVYTVVQTALSETFRALNYCFNALESSITSAGFSQTSLDSFKTNISSQISTISTAVSSLQSGKQALDDAILAYDTNVAAADSSLYQTKASYEDARTRSENTLSSAKLSLEQQVTTAESRVEAAAKSLKVAQTQLKRTTAAPRLQDITLTRSQLRQAEASLELLKNQIANNSLKAPVDGVITEVNYKLGEQATGAEAVVKLMAQDGFELDLDVAETDIAKIKLNNQAVVTFDTYGDAVKLEGRVSFIEPAETIIQGVIYYKVKINFIAGDLEIKPGMTATANITTANRDNVVLVPLRAVLEDKNGRKYVKILEGDQPREVDVTVGLVGDGGMVEVLSGVNEGEEVITFTKSPTK